MSLVEAFMNDVMDKATSMEEHLFIGTITGIAVSAFLSHHLFAVVVVFQQTTIYNLLNFDDVIARKNSTWMLHDRVLHLGFHRYKFPIHGIEISNDGARVQLRG